MTKPYIESLKPLTNWKNEPTVSALKQHYLDSQSDRTAHIIKVNKWLDNLNITGTALPKQRKGRSQIVPKLIRKQAEWRYAALSEPFLSTEDVFNVDPVTYEDTPAAIQNQLVLNYQFNTKINKIKFIDEYVRTAVDEGTVILRTGWNFKEAEKEVKEEELTFIMPSNEEEAAKITQAIQMMQSNPEAIQELPPEMQQAVQLSMQNGQLIYPKYVTKKVKKMVTVANHPTVEICHYKNVTIDPTCNGDISKAAFIIFSFDTNLAELKQDSRYKNLEYINTTSESAALNGEDINSNGGSNFIFNEKLKKKLTAHEYWGYWDIYGDDVLHPFVCTFVGDVMIRLELNPFPDGELPFIVVPYLPCRFSIYGEPDGELLEENQKINAAVIRGMIDVMGRSANGQLGIRKDALDLTNKRKFLGGEDYEFNAHIDPRQAFYMHTYPEIPQSANFMVQLQNNDAESLTGIKAFTNGISGQALGNTATAVRSALDATSKRELGILRRLAEGIKQVGRKFISMNSEFLSEEEIIRVTNSEFVRIRRDDLAGNFDLKLTISTAEADNQKAEELAFMLQTLGTNAGIDLYKMLLSDIAKLRKMPGLAKRIEEYSPKPDPMAEQETQLKFALMQSEIEENKAKAMFAQAEAQLAAARAQKEVAMAANLSSDTDLKNLNYLEQESGTKQERDLQKLGQQAKSNIELKVAEKALDRQNKLAEIAMQNTTPTI